MVDGGPRHAGGRAALGRWAVLAALLTLAACSFSDDADSADTGDTAEDDVVDPRTLVEVATVVSGSVGDHVVSSASVESEAQAAIIPETQGMVTAVYAEEGDAVTKGQLLALVASPTLDAAWERAAAEVSAAKADLDAADRLVAQGAIARTEKDAAQRRYDLAVTALDEASKTRGFTRLEAPIDGTIATRNVRFGELASPPTPAFTVVDLSRLRVIVNLPERDVHRVREGLTATLQSAYDEKSIATGRVLRVSPVVEAQTGTVRVTVALDPGQSVLRPGQFVSVRIEVDRHEGVLTLPRRAIVYEEGRAYVFVVTEGTPEDGEKPEKKKEEGGFKFPWDDDEEEKEPEIPGPHRRATRTLVKIGFEEGETAEIVEGANAGDVVVSLGNQALRDGARVRLPEDPTLRAKKPTDESAPG